MSNFRLSALSFLTLTLAACSTLPTPGQTSSGSRSLSSQALTCAAWSATTVYNAGDTASAGGVTYKANWWTQGDAPATHSGPSGSGQPWSVISGTCGTTSPGGDTTAPSVSLSASPSSVTTAGNISLSASASDNVGVSKVEFYQGTTLLSTDTTAPYTASEAVTSAQNGTRSYTAKAFDAAGNTKSASASVTVNISTTGGGTTPTGLNYFSAPYILPGESTPNLSSVMSATGQKTFMLAFILAPSGGGCTPTWDGTRTLSGDTVMGPLINTIRSNGGDINVSVGGYGGTKLGQVCADAASTAAAYQQVITKYKLKAMDFDLEEPEYENLQAINNEIGAVAILLANNPGLQVSFTVPGTSSGTGYFGKNVLDTAKRLGATNANFSIMPFDGGFNGASSQIAALEQFHTMLMTAFGWDSATAYKHEGVSMMNGRTDTAEHFYPADFQTVLDYAHSKGLGRYTFWSVGRDRACPNNADQLSASCSGIVQNDWDFTKFTAKF